MRLDSLLEQLKRRKVFRAAGVYVAVGLGIVYAADTILPALALPPWTVTLVIVLVGLGFPLAVGLAWAFDATGDGVVRTADGSDQEVVTPRVAKAAPIGESEVATGSARDPTEFQSRPAIVVLPFSDMSPTADNEFFSDGLTEEIIADLAAVKRLMVISRTSAMQLKNTSKDLRSIGRELGVRYVLEGSVRKAGTRLRITAQLIDAHTDHHLWARKYDGSIDDVFDVQERVSREIVAALDVTLTTEEDDRLSDHPVRDARAFELYLRARQQIRRYSTEGVADFLARAIEIEGETPALRALRGWAWVNEVRIGVSRDQLVLTRAEDEARDLIAEAPGSGYGHALLGYIEYERGNMPAAVTHFHTALALEPNDPDSLVYQALAYGSAGQYESELEVGAQLLAVDPLGPLTHLVLGSANWFVGRAEDGTASLQRALELDPTNLLVHWALGYHYLLIQDLEGARRHRAWLDENGRDVPYTRQMNSLMLGLDGRAEDALRELDGIDISFLDGHHSFHVAESYAMAGSADRALDLLESAVRLGFYPYHYFEKYCPFLEPLRDNPRFAVIVSSALERKALFENATLTSAGTESR